LIRQEHNVTQDTINTNATTDRYIIQMHNLFILDAQGEYGVMVKFLEYIQKTHIAKTNATKNTNLLATSYKYVIVNSLALDTR